MFYPSIFENIFPHSIYSNDRYLVHMFRWSLAEMIIVFKLKYPIRNKSIILIIIIPLQILRGLYRFRESLNRFIWNVSFAWCLSLGKAYVYRKRDVQNISSVGLQTKNVNASDIGIVIWRLNEIYKAARPTFGNVLNLFENSSLDYKSYCKLLDIYSEHFSDARQTIIVGFWDSENGNFGNFR